MLVIFTFIVCFISFIILYFEKFHRDTKLIRRIPGPKSWPLVGNSLNLLKPPTEIFSYIQGLHKKFGKIIQLHSVGIYAIVISDPVDVEKILSSPNYIKKREPYTFLKPWLGEGLLLSNGSKWHNRRKLLTQAFHFNILKKYMVAVKDCTEEFLNYYYNKSHEEITDLVALTRLITLGVMCETTMNISINKLKQSQRDKYIQSIHNMGTCFVKRTTNALFSFDAIFNLSKYSSIQKQALKYLHKFTSDIIKNRRKILKQSNDIIFDDNGEIVEDSIGIKRKLAMLDLLIYKEKQGDIDNEGIREEVDTFMFEGHDTTAVSLNFTLMIFANEAHIQDKLFEELKRIFGSSSRSPTIEDLTEMSYLECCIKESLRMYPSAPIISRCMPKNTVIGNYMVPENTACCINIYGIHHDPDLFPEPEKFIPERFLTDALKIRHTYSYLPFSAGPRNCIGQKFAMMELKTILSGILRRFRLEPVTKPDDIVFTSDIVLRVENPIYVRFRKREFDFTRQKEARN